MRGSRVFSNPVTYVHVHVHMHSQIWVQYSAYYIIYNINGYYVRVAVSLSYVLYYTIVIEVAFTQSLFSGDEASRVIEATIMATGVSQNPYEVAVAPAQIDPPSALGILL